MSQLTYEQVKGTGLANRCFDVVGNDTIGVKKGSTISNLCIEPKEVFIKDQVLTKSGEIKEVDIPSKFMTRQTYTLTGISGPLEFQDGKTITGTGTGNDKDLGVKNGKIIFTEQDGIDYAATTVQIPGGERVPYLFTVKQLVASGEGDAFKQGFKFGGSFKVPSYRTGLFLDPKGRGAVTGYD